ncbi:hypothetical protein RB620_23105 [Paenibacillus sp. LHD-117]|uniref:hypothetical protein n=1 Tax=Paenibacillus sp. LHD-117 TaxID=3071412 RepID=UPI0027DFA414|nr:hypothetical protein [Paenibacillus sp. LHD-117]MDQ6422322.1 hypothetical protein [Paenibacillus sp. LHD-117]
MNVSGSALYMGPKAFSSVFHGIVNVAVVDPDFVSVPTFIVVKSRWLLIKRKRQIQHT